MTRTFTKQPVVPIGYTGQSFNEWQKYLQAEREKINRPFKRMARKPKKA